MCLNGSGSVNRPKIRGAGPSISVWGVMQQQVADKPGRFLSNIATRTDLTCSERLHPHSPPAVSFMNHIGKLLAGSALGEPQPTIEVRRENVVTGSAQPEANSRPGASIIYTDDRVMRPSSSRRQHQMRQVLPGKGASPSVHSLRGEIWLKRAGDALNVPAGSVC